MCLYIANGVATTVLPDYDTDVRSTLAASLVCFMRALTTAGLSCASGGGRVELSNHGWWCGGIEERSAPPRCAQRR